MVPSVVGLPVPTVGLPVGICGCDVIPHVGAAGHGRYVIAGVCAAGEGCGVITGVCATGKSLRMIAPRL